MILKLENTLFKFSVVKNVVMDNKISDLIELELDSKLLLNKTLKLVSPLM